MSDNDNKSVPSFMKTDRGLTLNYEGETYTVLKGTKEYDDVLACLKERRFSDIPDVINKAKQIREFSGGAFDVKNGLLIVDGEEVPADLAKKILEFRDEGLPHEPLVAFAKNLLQNPSYRSVHQLFQFLEKNNHSITDDGCFIAYKKIREDWLDVHSATMENKPGMVVKMPRNKVNEDPNQTCSYGLHCANWDYASQFYAGGRMIEVKVNPKDVVAVPIDYNQAKMRVCEYLVLGETKNERRELYTPSQVPGATDDVAGASSHCADDYCDDTCDSDSNDEEYDEEYEEEDDFEVDRDVQEDYEKLLEYLSRDQALDAIENKYDRRTRDWLDENL